MTRLAPGLLALAALLGCDSAASQICTREWVQSVVAVVDASRLPVLDATVDVQRARSGDSIVCTGEPEAGCVATPSYRQERGEYLVLDDGIRVRRAGEWFTVTATRGAASATTDLRFGHDGCHIEKLAGPDTLVLR